MKKIVNISLITSLTITSVVASDSLSEAFTNGEFQGLLKSYYFQENQKDTGKSSIIHNGGTLNYKTDEYLGLKAGATFQFSSTFDINGTNRFGGDEDASGSVLSEAYLAYTRNNSTFKAGRQYIGTPLVAGSGSRMIRQSFQGYTFTNTDLPNSKISLIYVDRFQGRTDYNGKPGKFIKTFITNSPASAYEYTLEKGAYSIYLNNTSIKNLNINAQYLNATDRFKTSYFDAKYDFGIFNTKAQYIGTTFDNSSSKDGNFIALSFGGILPYIHFNMAVSENISDGNVESGLGYGADTSLTGNEIYGGVFSYLAGAKAYKLSIGTKVINDFAIDVIHTYSDLENGKSNDTETDIIVSYNYSKNLNISLLHAIIDGTEDYSRANAKNESRLKINYTF
jgi:hypothetical protein